MQANVPLPLDEPLQFVKRTRRPLARTRSRAHGDSKRLKGYRTTACSSPTRVPKADSYSTPTGESYAAKFDGQDYPYKGNPGVTSVVIKRIDDRTIEETGKRDGSAVYVTEMTVSSDGQSMNIVTDDKRRGTTDKYVATKQ